MVKRKKIVIQLISVWLALCLPLKLIKEDSTINLGTSSEENKRDSGNSSSEEKTPLLVLPYTPYFTRNNKVENERLFDLKAKYSHKIGFAYKETDPSEFLPSSRDPWEGIQKLPSEYERLIDEPDSSHYGSSSNPLISARSGSQKGGRALPHIDNNNVDPVVKWPSQPIPPDDSLPAYKLVYESPNNKPIISIPSPSIKTPVPPPYPPPRSIRTLSQTIPQVVQRPSPLSLSTALQTIQPFQREQKVTKLSKNPLTRFKQQSNPLNTKLPSLNQIHKNIKGLLPTLPTAPPSQGYPNPGVKIPTYFGTVLVTIKPWLNSIQHVLAKVMSSSAKANSSNSNPYTTVTEVPLPLPVPTYLPISKDSEFSAGFQILVQYIAAMVGFALILII